MVDKQEKIKRWIEIGNGNYWIQEAEDPPFNENSFYQCSNLKELQKKLNHGNWCLGQAFYLADICFIQQINGGNEWLVIKGEIAFESISYDDYDSQKFRQFVQDVKEATAEELKSLNYRSDNHGDHQDVE